MQDGRDLSRGEDGNGRLALLRTQTLHAGGYTELAFMRNYCLTARLPNVLVGHSVEGSEDGESRDGKVLMLCQRSAARTPLKPISVRPEARRKRPRAHP